MKKHTHLILTAAKNMGGTRSLLLSSLLSLSIVFPAQGQVLEEILVTAQKRNANLQDEAVSITAVSADTLSRSGVIGTRDLQTLVPGLTISGGQTPIIGLRGISSNNALPTGDPAIAFHLDGAYIGRASAVKSGFFDLERVEVLRGPQGILYGRNATGGSINVISKKPGFESEGFIEAQIGDYDRRNLKGGVTMPLVDDKLTTRIAFNYDHRDSFKDLQGSVEDDHSGNAINEIAYRIHTLYQASENLSMLFTFENSEGDGGNDLSIFLPADPSSDPFVGRLNTEEDEEDDNQMARFELNSEHEWGKITYIASWFDHSSLSVFDQDGGPVGRNTVSQSLTSEQITHELRLASNGESVLDWTFGLYAFDEESTRILDINFVPFLQLDNDIPDFEASSRAVFGNLTYSFSESLRVTAGLRYSDDEKTETDSTRIRVFQGMSTPAVSGSQSGEWSSTDWQLGIEMDLSSDHMIYAKAGTGYKSGGFIDAISAVSVGLTDAGAALYDPEELFSVEVGHKGEFFDNRLRVNSSAYYYDYSDQQLFVVESGANIIENADSEVYGFEIEALAAPTENLLANLSIAYNHSELDEGTVLVDGTIPLAPMSPNGLPTDVSGNRLARSPEWTFTLGLQYTWNLANGGRVIPSISYHWEDDTDLREFNNPLDIQESWHETDARITYRPANDAWFIEAWGKNLENPKTAADVVGSQMRVGGDRRRDLVIREPRTVGVRLGYQFN